MRLLTAACSALSFLFVTAALAAPALPPGVTQGASVEGITEYDLANGLRVLFAPDPTKPTTTVNTTYLVGSRNEHYGETGMAHLLEHLMFKGTPKYPQVWKEFTRLGLSANGSTWFDRTNYFASFAADESTLDWYLHWSADAMTHSFIARKDLDSEMTVVRNELEKGENDPREILLQRAMAAAYVWHNYGKDTIGARADVENVNIEHLQAFYRNYYQPDNAVLIVTGRFDEAKTLALIAKEFGKIPRPKRKLDPTYTLDIAQDGERTVVIRRVGDTPYVLAAYHIPAAGSPDYAAFVILNTILGDTPTGRLYKSLVETKQAANIYSESLGFKEPGIAFFRAQLPSDGSVETAKATLIATVEGVAKSPVTQAEVDRARTKYLKDFDLLLADPEGVGVELSTAISQGDWRLFFLERDRVRSITVDQVQKAAASYLTQDNRTLALFIPTTQPARPPAPAFVEVAPMVKGYKGDPPVAKGEAFDATPANIEARAKRLTLANGMKVVMVPKRTRGATAVVQMLMNYGDEKSRMGTRFSGELAVAMLERGAGGMSRQEIQDAFDKMKARVAFAGGGPLPVTVTVETTRENLPAVLRLVAKILRSPEFPSADFEQLKNQRVTSVESLRKEPTALSSIALRRHGNPYSKDDVRYVPDVDERIAAYRNAKLEDAKDFHARFFGADHMNVAAVGDFDADALGQLLKELFADWKARESFTRLPDPWHDVKPAHLKFETPDRANACFRAGLLFPMRDDDPQYPAILVANRIFGEAPGSMLWQRLREQDGLTYGVYSSVDAEAGDKLATFSASAILAPQNLAKLESGFNEELAHAYKEGFTADQLKDATAGLIRDRQLARAQDTALADVLTERLDYDRTLDFDAKKDRAIESVTLEQANAAFRKYIDPSKLTTVSAGDFAKP